MASSAVRGDDPAGGWRVQPAIVLAIREEPDAAGRSPEDVPCLAHVSHGEVPEWERSIAVTRRVTRDCHILGSSD